MNYEYYMSKCIELALLSEGHVSPNPLVGCLIVNDKGEIVAQGRHEKFGGAHAEQNALNLAKEKAKGAILFVNLEPCNHYGKTPPCAQLIVQSGIKKVVIGTKDLNPKAQGGIETLKQAGIEVIDGILENDCKKLNEIFFFSLNHSRPFIAIKTATTLDGKIAASDGSSKWITSENSRAEVQNLRNKYDAIMTTAKTVIADNPSLTCRKKNGRNPLRIVIDKYHLLNSDYKVFAENEGKVLHHIGHFDTEFAKKLCSKGIKSILVEAGGNFNANLLQQGLVDKIYHFIAPKILGDNSGISWVNGLYAKNINSTLNFSIESAKNFAPDIMLELYPQM